MPLKDERFVDGRVMESDYYGEMIEHPFLEQIRATIYLGCETENS